MIKGFLLMNGMFCGLFCAFKSPQQKMAFFGLNVIQRSIDRNAVNPSTNRRFSLKLMRFSKNIDKDILNDFFGFLFLLRVAQRRTIHSGGKAFIQLLKSGFIASANSGQKYLVGRRQVS